jgi:outer membrane protein OmpA-like peptidoglycan-associated protein
MNNRTYVATAVASLLLAACASTPLPPQELVDARETVRSAELDPATVTGAPLELKRASDALARANLLFANREPLSDIASAAYIARQEARTALAIGAAKAREDALKAAQSERERARADVQAREAERARNDASLARTDARVARNDAAAAKAAADAERARALGAEGKAAEAASRASDAERQAAVAQANASQAQQQAALLQQQLNELQAKQTERGLLVTLGDVLFEFNRADVKPTATAELRKLADFLRQYPARHVLIEGHTDNIGSDAYNLQLSQRRAEAVASVLRGMGVVEPRVSVVGYGKSHPIADNSTDTNRALNRRVEVYISNDDQPVRQRSS